MKVVRSVSPDPKKASSLSTVTMKVSLCWTSHLKGQVNQILRWIPYVSWLTQVRFTSFPLTCDVSIFTSVCCQEMRAKNADNKKEASIARTPVRGRVNLSDMVKNRTARYLIEARSTARNVVLLRNPARHMSTMKLTYVADTVGGGVLELWLRTAIIEHLTILSLVNKTGNRML